MKALSFICLISTLSLTPLMADKSFQADLAKKTKPSEKETNIPPKQALEKHAKASIETADGQDELSADVQDLIQEQANPKVIELLDDAETLMGEATELLESKDTGSNTIAIQTEIIEKIYEAAKQKQQGQPGQPQSGSGSMMEMMKGMMGEGQGEPSEGQGDSQKGGEGSEGASDQENDQTSGSATNTKEERRVPKNTSAPNQNLPKEEQRALDAYNK